MTCTVLVYAYLTTKNKMSVYDTLVEGINDLKSKGYTTDFNLSFDKVECAKSGICLSPTDFKIVEFFRFEGATNPSDQSALYAIESKDGSVKGTLVTAYGMYTEPVSDNMLQKLSMQDGR